MAAEWNLSNADVECKAVLEKLLRPNHFRLIPNFIVHATPGQKKAMTTIAQLLDYQTRGTLRSEVLREVPYSKLGYQKNVPVKPNGFGMPTLANMKGASLDRAVLDDGFKQIHLCASGPGRHSGMSPGPGGGNNPHCRFKSGKEVDRAYVLGYRPLRQQRVAKLLHPKALAWTEKFLLQESTKQDRCRLVQALEHLQQVFDQIPGYVQLKENAVQASGTSGLRRSTSAGADLRGTRQRTIQDDLFEHSKIIHRKHPSELEYEFSKMPQFPDMHNDTGPPSHPEVKRDQRSNVYFPGNNQKLVSTYNEQYTAAVSTPSRPSLFRPKSATPPQSLEPLRRSASSPNLRPASAPGGGGPQRRGNLSPRMHMVTRMRPRSLSNCFPPNQEGLCH